MNYIEIENKFYILADSSGVENRTMVLKQGDSFGVFDRNGDIAPLGRQSPYGVYHEGTRFLSHLQLSIEGHRPLLLSANLREENELMIVDLTNADYQNAKGELIHKGLVHVMRTKFLWKGVCYERMRFSNFDQDTRTFRLNLVVDADYADIFEVRGMNRADKGNKLPSSQEGGDTLLLSYLGLDSIKRSTRIVFSPSPERLENGEAGYTIALEAKETHDIYLSMAFEIGDQRPRLLSYEEAHDQMLAGLEEMKKKNTVISTDNESFNEWIDRSMADLNTMVTETDKGLYPYAGVPWYSTPFGRDGIITAFMCLWMNPEIARGVLHYLAKTQASDYIEFQDAEPGKILHEKRGGEMAELGEVPFKLYYGTIDATPLFISLAGAYYERTGDLDTIRTIWPNILRALEWMDTDGDLDGDGYLEYQVKSKIGLANQGWKDSFDSISYDNGQLAEAPIALCEVQGYAYDAKRSAANLATALGHSDMANGLLQEAERLKERFARDFWDEKRGCYVLALDAKKRPCRVVSSNAGHALFSGIATPEHAAKMAKVLLSQQMFSGWGIRTLSTDELRYNPMSYHNGSVWPHDTAMIAYGLAQYGFQAEVQKIVSGTFETAMAVELNRLPELFCGFEKRSGEGPTAYPVACSPQAWAVASVFILVQSMLGLRIIANENLLHFTNPSLPPYLQEITIRHLKVGEHDVALQIRMQRGEVVVTLLNHEQDIHIHIEREVYS
jgi:glycogen debranching enzyme